MIRFISLWLAIIFFTQGFLFAESKPIFISLGPDCQAAIALRHYGLREAAYPFDWMFIEDLDGIKLALDEDFVNFLNPLYLQYREHYIYNMYYRMGFVHDFPTCYQPTVAPDGENGGFIVLNYLDYLPAVQQKYVNRISRLKNLLQSNHEVIFIRTNESFFSTSYFTMMLKNKYPHLNFLFISVHNEEKLNFDWNLDRVANIFVDHHAERDATGRWWSLNVWFCIFSQIEGLREHLKTVYH